MPQLSDFGEHEVDLTAACEQLCLIACVYQDAQAGVEELIGAQGEILLYLHRPLSWPVSFVAIRSGVDRYFVSMAGTTNLFPQVLGHIQGSFGRPFRPGTPPPFNGGVVNGQWEDVFETVMSEIQNALPADPDGLDFHFSGHSYGGAVAQLAGFYYSTTLARLTQVMTFGQPKALTTRVSPPFPSRYWRIASTSDPVQYIPSDPDTVANTLWLPQLEWFAQEMPWDHYGEYRSISPAGRWNFYGPGPEELPEGVTLNPVGQHLLANYWGRLRAQYIREGGTAQAALALDITDRVLKNGTEQPRVPTLPRTVRGPTGTPIVIPLYDGLQTRKTRTGDDMPRLTGEKVRVVVKFNQTFGEDLIGQGWQETWTLSVSGSTRPLDTALNAVARMYEARKEVLTTNCALVSMTASMIGQPGVSRPRSTGSTAFGKGLDVDPASSVGAGVFFAGVDASSSYRDIRIIRGLSQKNLQPQLVSPKGKADGAFQKWVNKWTVSLGIPYRDLEGGGGTAQFGMYVRSKEQALANRHAIEAVTLSARGRMEFLIVGQDTGLAPGDQIKVSVKRQKCAKGVSGTYRIAPGGVTLVGSSDTKITVLGGFCCDPAALDSLTGYLNPISYEIWSYDTWTIDVPGHKDTGRGFFASRGKSNKSCCI